jgi:hypothetical protein
MPISISPLSLEDITGAVDAIQKAFSEDPYNLWVYNDRSKVSDRLMVRLLALRIVLGTQNIPPHCCGNDVKYALDKAD